MRARRYGGPRCLVCLAWLAWLGRCARVGVDADERACSEASRPFGHLSTLRIAAPADGTVVWGAFAVRIEFSHRVSPVTEPPEALPEAFDVMLDGEHALTVTLRNSSRSFYLVHLPLLPAGPHLLQVAKRYPGDDAEGAPEWPLLEDDRARYQSMGRERQSSEPTQRPASGGHFSVMTRRRLAEGLQEERQRWLPEKTAILVVDMWNFHGCYPAMLRAHALAAPVNRVISAARQRGAFIIHVPSRSYCLPPAPLFVPQATMSLEISKPAH